MRWFFFLLLSVISLDRFTKQLAIIFLRDTGESITIIPGLFSLTYAENRGIAFGMEFLPPAVLLTLTTIIVSGVIIYTLTRGNRQPLFLGSFGLIAGGGIGNLIDRFTTGRVVDFLYFDLYRGELFGHWIALWPIFNVADSAITIGACMLIIFNSRIFPDSTAAGENNVC
ncbi:MAG: signal peptidase II [Chlorobium sp.]|nr:signal peptidase II [Chlorobium phaeovibrioides]NQU45940.1 signal peptidase II [Chlorobium sp.]